MCTGDAFEVSSMKVKTVVQGDLDSDNLHLSGDGAGPPGHMRCKLAYEVDSGCVVVNWGSEFTIKGIGLVFGDR